ncbi:MAG: hypothetical protein SGPRY_010587, partial [Prymnesium sp.]
MLALFSAAACSTGQFDFDLLVIGGGSGGIACAKEAASLGASVALADYVHPSARGTTWGLGGTCVNVGCIPKKLMHRAGQLRRIIEQDAPAFGYDLSPLEGEEGEEGEGVQEKAPHVAHSWSTLVLHVQRHIKSLNFGYLSSLRKKGVVYFNKHASFAGGHQVMLRGPKGDEKVVSARQIVIAVGGRPRLPEGFEGASEACIVSDDLFSLKTAPGASLVVGGGYVALECAGFLRSLGFEVSLLLRSIPLRGFDRQCSEMVLSQLEGEGVRVIRGSPLHAERLPSSRTRVRWEEATGGQHEAEFETVLVATGRTADTKSLQLSAVGLSANRDGKISSVDEATGVPHVFVIGASLPLPCRFSFNSPIATQ